ncbi:2OG-Fe(II) oxygenase [Solimicrobium silvestre]|uniref:Prolyl 4-hydroxylase n=1 Tax=Solimicrobium silvestre TaxID=2099400 RepID=A0A2S9H351_9BURK|nr:2OG-Fe(II) oxygenase [Solimicrobium silvestre]PRC94409.1 hypothetical protein S2091_1030 [Solimicrobium silvestre]
MTDWRITEKLAIAELDWPRITSDLDKEGYALLPQLLNSVQVKALTTLVRDVDSRERWQSLANLDLGRGNIARLSTPLPDLLDAWREALYRQLAPIAHRWAEILGADCHYPDTLISYLRANHEAGQTDSLTTASCLREGDFQALHQHAEDKYIFPLQLVILLSDPDTDFTGGEFVMTEQRPRMQSRPMVLPLQQGDAALITVAHRPHLGSKGYYRVNLKHAISRVRGGERIGIELLFHNDAQGNPFIP